MQLHIWGPAFDLPSIDAECLATIAYFHQVLPPEQWLLILGQDSSISPSGELPYLVDGDRGVAGFYPIRDHLKAIGHDLDPHLSKQRHANGVAIKSCFSNHAVPLLDYALYTSNNYSSHTRPAWRHLIGPQSVLTPAPCADRYTAAQPRAAALGLEASPLDDAPSDSSTGFTPEQRQEARMISSSPSLLFRKRQTLQAALRERQSQTRFRLDSLVDDFLEPIDAMLQKGSYLLDDGNESKPRPTSIDCLAFGYLALLIHNDMSNNMLADNIRKRYPRVVQYVARLRHDFFEHAIFDAPIILKASIGTDAATPATISGLPYRTLPTPDLSISLAQSSKNLFSRLLRPLMHQPLLFNTSSGPLIKKPSSLTLRSWTDPFSLLLTLSGSLLAGTAWFLYAATHSGQEKNKYFARPHQRLGSFGAAGDMLSALRMPR